MRHYGYSQKKNILFYRLGGEVSKVYPDLLLATMDILYTQYKNIRGKDRGAFNDQARETVRNY